LCSFSSPPPLLLLLLLLLLVLLLLVLVLVLVLVISPPTFRRQFHPLVFVFVFVVVILHHYTPHRLVHLGVFLEPSVFHQHILPSSNCLALS
jgi:hypothetical protein